MRAPLTSVQLYVQLGAVHVHDANGHGLIPAEDVPALAAKANRSDRGMAWLNGRGYQRDLLNSAVDLLTRTFGPCANCHEAPGTQDMGDDTRFCPECCSAAQGTRHDDKEAY